MNFRKCSLPVLLLMVTMAFFSFTEKKNPKILMIGDSTMANKPLEGGNTERGWGQALPGLLDQEIKVENYAKNGRSSRSFRGEGLWDTVYGRITPGDFVFIQFGHNDQKSDTARHSDADTDFKANLARYVKQTREKGGVPVLFTSIARRKFQDSVLVDTHNRYIDAVREVGKETKTPVVDMNARSIELFTAYGVEGTTKLFNHVLPKTQACRPEGKLDDTHFAIKGARELAKIAAEELSKLFPELAPHFVKSDFVVSKDGCGDFFTVQQAIDAVPDMRKKPTVIYIKNGVYKEKLVVPNSKNSIRLIGENNEKTVLTYSHFAKALNTFGEEVGTSGSASCYVYGADFRAENLTFENSAGPVGQAVAILIVGDKAAFKNCRFLGFQDTLYSHGTRDASSAREYFENCYIEGTVDFIFGWATAWFEGCTIYAKTNGYYTAASTPENQKHGYVFNNCHITGAEGVQSYLGRPWRINAQTVFQNCRLDATVRAEGWHNWNKKEAESTTFYAEFNNSGDGASQNKRVKWAKKMDKALSMQDVLGDWDPSK